MLPTDLGSHLQPDGPTTTPNSDFSLNPSLRLVRTPLSKVLPQSHLKSPSYRTSKQSKFGVRRHSTWRILLKHPTIHMPNQTPVSRRHTQSPRAIHVRRRSLLMHYGMTTSRSTRRIPQLHHHIPTHRTRQPPLPQTHTQCPPHQSPHMCHRLDNRLHMSTTSKARAGGKSGRRLLEETRTGAAAVLAL
jgi:hypothetical protein